MPSPISASPAPTHCKATPLRAAQPTRKETTSVGFIRDTAFEWLEAKYKNLQPDSLTEFVLKKAEDEIKDFEIGFRFTAPISYLRFQWAP